jgi:hypothetical protein
MTEELFNDLAMHEEDFAESHAVLASAAPDEAEASKDTAGDTVCLFCNDCLFMWEAECDNVSTLIATEHRADDPTVTNSTHRKTSFRYIWSVRNGIGQKNVRTKHPECVKTGIRALFPDNIFMGFKEE